MAIASLDNYIASAKQLIPFSNTTTRTSVASAYFSVFDVAGNPGAGTLAGSSTTTGTVPTDATAGCPAINAFGGSATGYLAKVSFGCTVACRIYLYDLLWKGGAYAFNASTSGNTPTSYSSRVPGGTDYNGLEIWLEQVTAGTGSQSVAVTYINQAGTTGRSTGTVVTATNIVGRCHRLPLQAGDTGVQGVTGVVGSVASAGTFNILVLRPLDTERINAANVSVTHDWSQTGSPILFADSALYRLISADSTSTGISELGIVVANG